ncbi:uncharacterized protein SAPINGB_P000869 [Magnusiomyces paraingens]|uniref:Signal recognition particle receptor subunit beta n=1 Tax=Magnusiomyces paraingens TaxID=2606893 RepID=A0A5E8B2S8_9ASCO|nr:uncharacterized protein SAPINGB_P000869 [Saprochaete ingens]VVT45744.1 unnamed protein product [Saprochaete ingens]
MVVEFLYANITGIIVALVCILLGIALTVYRTGNNLPGGRKRNSQPTIIIAGPPSGGKTSLYTLLTTGKVEDTVTTQIPNVYNSFSIPFDSETDASRITLIDLPGHPKLIHHLDEALLVNSNIKGILFVLDGASGTRGIEQAAQYLFKVLSRTEYRMGGIDMMIACNKADLFSMVPAAKLRKILEQELTFIRDARAQGLGTVKNEDTLGGRAARDNPEDDDAEGSWLGQGEPIDFSKLDGEIAIADGSVKTKSVESWKRWIEGVGVN